MSSATHKHSSVLVSDFSEVSGLFWFVLLPTVLSQTAFGVAFDRSELIWMTGYAEPTRDATDTLDFKLGIGMTVDVEPWFIRIFMIVFCLADKPVPMISEGSLWHLSCVWICSFMATSLHHICLCPAPVMLGQEASDGSVTQLCWHPPAPALPPPLIPSPFIISLRPSLAFLSDP